MIIRILATIAGLGALTSAPAWACTVTLRADGNTAAIQHAIDRPGKINPVVCLKAGVYRGARLVATRSATIRRVGNDKVVLDAGGQGRILTIGADSLDVRLEGLTFTNGKSDRGGAIALMKKSRLILQDCWLYGNSSTLHGGGALAASAGQLDLIRTRVTGNHGDRAAAVDLSGSVRARMFSTLIADNEAKGTVDPPVRLSGTAQLEVVGSTVAYNGGSGIVVQPDGGGRRMLVVRSSVVMGRPDAIAVLRSEAADVSVENSVLWGNYGFVALDLATKRSLPGFSLKGAERYRPERGSVAIGIGKCTDPLVRKDLTGLPRGATCTVGALEAPVVDVRWTLLERKKQQLKQQPKDWRDI